MSGAPDLAALLGEIRACRHCAGLLPHAPRPVVQAGDTARLVIVGQAPGNRVHQTGIPWNDPSGDRLRAWLQIDRAVFYDPAQVALVPMGFCFPGTDAKGGDRPPRRECAPLWHDAVFGHLPQERLTLLVGQYAQARYLGRARKASLTETVRAWPDYRPEHIPLPHPSWRNTGWLKKNPWFEAELLPDLRARIACLLAGDDSDP